MLVKAIKTPPILSGSMSIFELLDSALSTVDEQEIIVVTSKVVSLCENRTIPVGSIDKEQLIYREADLYCVPNDNAHQYHYTILNNTLIPASGIDESNGNGNYVLWPSDPQASANQIRLYILKRFQIKQVGVIITDSTIFPSRWGTLGMAIAHSGFSPVKDYIGTSDIFGRTLAMSKANIAGGLAAAAVLCMGEGAEQTPIALIEDVAFVEFQTEDPSSEERAGYYVSPLNDAPFAPFFNSLPWHLGYNRQQQHDSVLPEEQ
jgi:F420-0:gamma-glutamyl ligase